MPTIRVCSGRHFARWCVDAMQDSLDVTSASTIGSPKTFISLCSKDTRTAIRCSRTYLLSKQPLPRLFCQTPCLSLDELNFNLQSRFYLNTSKPQVNGVGSFQDERCVENRGPHAIFKHIVKQARPRKGQHALPVASPTQSKNTNVSSVSGSGAGRRHVNK
jgi:hypothetical protein